LHPLESAAFMRRTPETVIGRSAQPPEGFVNVAIEPAPRLTSSDAGDCGADSGFSTQSAPKRSLHSARKRFVVRSGSSSAARLRAGLNAWAATTVERRSTADGQRTFARSEESIRLGKRLASRARFSAHATAHDLCRVLSFLAEQCTATRNPWFDTGPSSVL
jgi:hypothetical protein